MSDKPVQPIVSLTPFLGNRWWIKARVTDKSDKRSWNKPTSSGQLFSCTLVDDTAAIRATFFNEAVNQFYDMLAAGQVYYISGGSVKAANRRFNSVNNEYEVSFDKDAQITKCLDGDTSSIPQQRFNFVVLGALARREANSMVDVLGVVHEDKGISKFTSKAGQALTKRSITLADTSSKVELTLWNEQAESWNHPLGSVIAVRNCKVGNFDGVNISTSMQSVIETHPPEAEARALRNWYNTTRGADVQSISGTGRAGGEFVGETKRKFFEDIERERMGGGEKPDYIEVCCMPTYIKTDSMWYEACPTCNKKVPLSDPSATTGRCEKCDKNVQPEARYMASIQASDGVQQLWVTLFNEAGEQFFGCTAPELKRKTQAGPAELSRLSLTVLYKPIILRCRVKQEQRDDGPRTQVTALKVTPVVDPITTQECNTMVACIGQYIN